MNQQTSGNKPFYLRIWRRLVLRSISQLVVSGIILFLILKLLPGLGSVHDILSAMWVIAILSILQALLWPVFVQVFLWLFYKISPIFMFLVFPVFSIALLTVFIMAGSWLSADFSINGFGSAFLVALLLNIISLLFAVIFATDDESAVYYWTLKRLGKRVIKDEDVGKPGIIFLEIDGLGRRVLVDAMRKGKAPNMKRWLNKGSHKLAGWTSDLSSQTSAAQAGILHGNNFDIPAFRWYDREQRRVVISSSISDVSNLEKKLSNGLGLMCDGGVARACLFSGDASRVLMTASRPLEMTSVDLRSYYINPLSILRSISLMVWDWILEKKAAWGQWLKNDEPRIKRSGTYFILRSLITVFLRDFSLFTLKGDMYSGVPYAYITLAGYDEVAHHSGIESPDALEVLRKLDKEFGKLEKIAGDVPRKYKFVVLSDHGQTQGKTFSSRYGEKLEDLIKRLLNTDGSKYSITGYKTKHESAYYIDAAFKDSSISNSGIGRKVKETLSNSQQIKVGREEIDNVIVLASGNLGLIYFSSFEHRVTFEEIQSFFPNLIPGLISHPGIGLIMVRSDNKGPVVFGKKGKIYLASGEAEGENIIEDYGPYAASMLNREDSFPDAPDILIVSTYWKETGEVAAFEELVGSHGGIGGAQSEPFILYPTEFDLVSDNILGAETMYHILKSWTQRIHS